MLTKFSIYVHVKLENSNWQRAVHFTLSLTLNAYFLNFQVVQNNSNYSLNNFDGTRSTPFMDLSKDEDRDMTDLSDMNADASTAAAAAAASAASEMSFPTFVPDIKLPQFPVMSAMDAALSAQSVENEFRGSRYTFDRKCVRSPSPTSSNVFFGNSDLLANRIGQFYPRPMPQIFQHHHLSKHFHPWHPDVSFFEGKQIGGHRKSPRPATLMHNFLQSGGALASGSNTSGTLNLSTNQYHQSPAHLLHQQQHHSRQN